LFLGLFTEGVREQGAELTFGYKTEEVVGGWRTVHNQELHNLYTSPDFIIVIKSSKTKW